MAALGDHSVSKRSEGGVNQDDQQLRGTTTITPEGIGGAPGMARIRPLSPQLPLDRERERTPPPSPPPRSSSSSSGKKRARSSILSSKEKFQKRDDNSSSTIDNAEDSNGSSVECMICGKMIPVVDRRNPDAEMSAHMDRCLNRRETTKARTRGRSDDYRGDDDSGDVNGGSGKKLRSSSSSDGLKDKKRKRIDDDEEEEWDPDGAPGGGSGGTSTSASGSTSEDE